MPVNLEFFEMYSSPPAATAVPGPPAANEVAGPLANTVCAPSSASPLEETVDLTRTEFFAMYDPPASPAASPAVPTATPLPTTGHPSVVDMYSAIDTHVDADDEVDIFDIFQGIGGPTAADNTAIPDAVFDDYVATATVTSPQPFAADENGHLSLPPELCSVFTMYSPPATTGIGPNSPTEHRASASSPLTALESDDSISGYGHDEYDSSQDGDTTGTDAHRSDAADTTMDPPHETLAAADILAALPEYLFDLEDEEEDFEMYM